MSGWTRDTALSHIEERGENVDDGYVIEMVEDILNDYNLLDGSVRVSHALDVLEARTRALAIHDPNDSERN